MNNRISGRRHLARVSVLTLALLGSAILGKADIMPNGIFTITYGAWGDTANDPITFTIALESSMQMSLDGYFNSVCFGCTTLAATVPDPDMEINPGGDELPFPEQGDMISIPPDTQSYRNTGADIQTLDFSTPYLSSRWDGQIFTCGGNEFNGCGFKVVTDPNTSQMMLDIRFTGPMVPEPSSWVLLLTVAAGITLKRALPFSKRR
jgi:hypothetical protein